MKEFWDNRYSNDAYAYGTEANLFFASTLKKLKPGKILLPAEGEGRNAVFAAKLGWEVVAFDVSENARVKALRLAEKEKVEIDYRIASFDVFPANNNSFDCIALIFAHFPNNLRQDYHKKLCQLLKPGGTIILEAFAKEQINNSTGGPKNIEQLYAKTELESDFSSLKKVDIETLKQILHEGEFHNGMSDLIRLVGFR